MPASFQPSDTLEELSRLLEHDDVFEPEDAIAEETVAVTPDKDFRGVPVDLVMRHDRSRRGSLGQYIIGQESL